MVVAVFVLRLTPDFNCWINPLLGVFITADLEPALGSIAATYSAVGRRNLTPTQTLGSNVGLSASDAEELVGHISSG